MLLAPQELIARFHQSQSQCVLAATGGGSSAIAELLVTPGGSKTVLEALIPYSAAALAEFLGRQPEHFCDTETALAMSMVAYLRALKLAAATPLPGAMQIGLGCTAALVSDRPRRGGHRGFVAVQTRTRTVLHSLVLKAGARDRRAEEALVGRLLLRSLMQSAGLDDELPLDLTTDESQQQIQQVGAALLVDLVHGQADLVWALPDGRLAPATELRAPPRGVLCGAFHPLHVGHTGLRAAAERRLGQPVVYEMTVRNVDKPPLDYLTIHSRRGQFAEHPLALTRAATFVEKAALFPGATFVVGTDTAARIIEPRYYGNRTDLMHDALAKIRQRNCRFLVAARLAPNGSVETLRDLPIPAAAADLFEQLPVEEFRVDASSTELRRSTGGREPRLSG